LNTSLLKRSHFRFKISPTGSNGKGGHRQQKTQLGAETIGVAAALLIGYSLGRINPEQSHLGASLPNRFFAAVITATLKEKCDIELMSPIFRCLGCGQYIERSLATYKKHMGQIFCSTCDDRKQLDAATGSKKT
jgi:hypothetical protein